MRVIVTGATGMLGQEVCRALTQRRDQIVAVSRQTIPGDGWFSLDVTDREACAELCVAVRPDVVIHLAYDQTSWAVTADGAAHVARGAALAGAHLVLMSSDLVFSHSRELRYEGDAPCPTKPYGAAKAAAEVASRSWVPTATIARSSVLIGRGDGHQERLVRAAATRQWGGSFYTDQWRCPTYAPDVARALVDCAHQRLPATVHLVSDDHLTRAEIACRIARFIAVDEGALDFAEAPADAPPADLHLARGAPTREWVSTPLRGLCELQGLHHQGC